MAVVKVVDGIVVQTWRDVKTVLEAKDKYGLDSAGLYEADHPAGTHYDGTVFHTPVRTPKVVEESSVIKALRDLAGEMGPSAVAKINGRFGLV